jgi:hypothetical protein
MSGTERDKLVMYRNKTDTIQRLQELGFTESEAKSWYWAVVRKPRLARAGVTISLTIGLFGLARSLLDSYLQSTLPTHLILQTLILVLGGFMIGYGIHYFTLAELSPEWSLVHRSLLRTLSSTKYSVLLILTAALMISYWGLPWNFNATIISKLANTEMRVTFVLAGITFFIASKSLPENVTKGIIVILAKGMGLFGMFLVLTSKQLYAAYPISQQMQLDLLCSSPW